MTDQQVNVYYEDRSGRFKPIQDYSGKLTTYRQTNKLKPAELSMEIPRGSPINQHSKLTVESQGRVLFRGAVKYKPNLTSSKKSIKAYCMTDLLLNRYAPRGYFYPQGNSEALFQNIFSDTFTDGIVPGLLALANSYLPAGQPYSVYDDAKSIICLTGCGTDSDLGTKSLFGLNHLYAKSLVECFSLTELAEASAIRYYTYYRDSQDLFVRIRKESYHDYGWYELGGLCSLNYKDTMCRLGAISDPTFELTGDLMLNNDAIGDLIADIVAGQGFNLHIRPDWNYVYLDINQEIGRGSEDGVYHFEESTDLAKLERKSTSKCAISTLQGVGLGNQYHTIEDHRPSLNVKREDQYSVPNGFKDINGILVSYTQMEYDERAIDYLYSITPKALDLILLPGDYIKLDPYQEETELLYCETLNRDLSTGRYTIDLGSGTTTLADVWEYLQSGTPAFKDNFLITQHDSISSSCSFYAADPTHAGTTGSMSISVPAGVKDTALNAKITVTISLNASTTTGGQVGRCSINIKINDIQIPVGAFSAPTIGESQNWQIPEFDVTDQITANASNTVKVDVGMAKDATGAHANYTGHPTISCSATMNFYKRTR